MYLPYSPYYSKLNTMVVSCCITMYPNVSNRIRFEACHSGIKPRGVKDFNHLANICDSMYRLEFAVIPGSCFPCKANPYSLLCPCKGFRQKGICHHVIGLTHRILKSDGTDEERLPSLNVFYMNERMCNNKKGKGRPKPLKSCLQRESSDEEDGDDRQAKRLLLKW